MWILCQIQKYWIQMQHILHIVEYCKAEIIGYAPQSKYTQLSTNERWNVILGTHIFHKTTPSKKRHTN